MNPKITIDQGRIASLCERWSIREMALFGSVLRDDFGPDSDVDVLVEFQAGARIGLFALSEIQEELVEIFGRPVDLISKKGLRPRMRQIVVESAQTVYATA